MIGSDESYNFQCFNFVGEISAGGNCEEIEWSLLVVLTDCKHDLI